MGVISRPRTSVAAAWRACSTACPAIDGDPSSASITCSGNDSTGQVTEACIVTLTGSPTSAIGRSMAFVVWTVHGLVGAAAGAYGPDDPSSADAGGPAETAAAAAMNASVAAVVLALIQDLLEACSSEVNAEDLRD